MACSWSSLLQVTPVEPLPLTSEKVNKSPKVEVIKCLDPPVPLDPTKGRFNRRLAVMLAGRPVGTELPVI